MRRYIITVTLLLSALLWSGCGAKNRHMLQKQQRFQSVPPQKAIILQKGEHRTSCAICGMNLPAWYKTNHAAHTKYGTRQYCSLHCLVHDNELNKTDLSNVMVVDTVTLKFIPALKAYYVVGSSKPGTMSKISKYAFGSKADAEAFAKKHGGKVMGFYEAYDIAIKDFVKKQ